MQYLVTGGAGFIGSHLTDAILARDVGNTVVCLDDLSAGSAKNLEHALRIAPGRVRLVEHAAGMNSWTRDLVADADFVFHLGARAGVASIMEHGVASIAGNFEATEAVFRAASFHKTPVLYASSSEVYGLCLQATERLSETHSLCFSDSPRWSYAVGKLLGEQLALAHHRERGLPVLVARIFNAVGPRQHKGHRLVLSSFVHQAVRNQPLQVYGNGEQERVFCCIEDTVTALLALHEGLLRRAYIGEIVNVGSSQRRTILELAEEVVSTTGSSSQIQRVPYSAGYPPGFEDSKHRIGAFDKLKLLTGLRLKRPLSDAIRAIEQEARQELAVENAPNA